MKTWIEPAALIVPPGTVLGDLPPLPEGPVTYAVGTGSIPADLASRSDTHDAAATRPAETERDQA